MKTKSIWFKKKTYGWGWTPANWKGWVVTALYALAVLLYGVVSQLGYQDFNVYLHIIIMTIATVAMIAVCYWKGEKPEWNWGKRI